MRLLRRAPRAVFPLRPRRASGRRRLLPPAILLAFLGAVMVALWMRFFPRDAQQNPPQGQMTREAVFTRFSDLDNDFDVLVVGGTPSGVASALAAARRGSRVLLVEGRPHLGGDIVYAMLNMFDVPMQPGQASPVSGIFAEFFGQLGMACDIQSARRLLENSVADRRDIQVAVRTRVARIIKDGNRVSGVVLHNTSDDSNSGTSEKEISARCVVDATDDASFAARAGAGYYLGRENANRDKRMQSAGLLFSVSGADWEAVRRYVSGKRPMRAMPKPRKTRANRTANIAIANVFFTALSNSHGRSNSRTRTDARHLKKARSKSAQDKKARSKARQADARRKIVWLRHGGGHGNYAWERGDIIRDYRPRGRDILFLSINFGHQSDGTIVLNTLNIVGVNGLNGTSKSAAMREARAELPAFINYLRHRMPGFENARLARVAPELYIRETRHIHGFYALKVEDIRAERRFFDRVARVSYPLDLHPYVMGQNNPFGRRRYFYTLPLRSLVPRKVDGVFVASRSLSATYSAAGSARVIPITMAAGEACGAAASLCAQNNVSPHDMMNDSKWVRELQDSLRKMGADIGDALPPSKPASEDSADSSRTTSQTPAPNALKVP